MPSGRPKEISFTPAVAGTVRVRCTFEMDWTGTAVTMAYAAAFCEQGGTTIYSQSGVYPPKYVLQAGRIEEVFNVSAGSLVKVGLFGSVAPLGSVNFYNIKVEARFVPI